jgi:hypothetical protein
MEHLILRAEIIWAKPNGLPESVTDRVRRAHEQVFHFTRQPRYYSAVDEIREAHTGNAGPAGPRAAVTNWESGNGKTHRTGRTDLDQFNPLGKLPGSVWSIPSQPLTVPPHLGVDHFAAFPMELPRRIILGWSPPGICTECGQGRRPVAWRQRDTFYGDGQHRPGAQQVRDGAAVTGYRQEAKWRTTTTIAGYACACTPYTDHPERRTRTTTPSRAKRQDGEARDALGLPRHHGNDWPEREPVREYHLDRWQPAPTRPAVVLDPFGGTGTTIDRSADYCRLAAWRTTDPAQRAAALQVPKPPQETTGQLGMFD